MKLLICTFLLFFASTLQAQKISGTWNGIIDAGIKLHIVFHFQTDEQGKSVCILDSPDQSIKGIPTELDYLSADSVCIHVPLLEMRFSGSLRGNYLQGTFTQMGQSIPLILQAGALERNRPQHPLSPYPYTSSEITFQNDEADITLAGTLTYPVNYEKGKRVPVILMVTGSGPENRDEEVFDHKPFLVIADYLARNGIASLRYDDRSVGQSSGDAPTANTLEVAADALAGLEFLHHRREFSKIGILGHSEGANVAFMLADERYTDFVISLAGIGVKGEDALYEQARLLSEKSGIDFSITKRDYISQVLDLNDPWLEFFIGYDPTVDLQKTHCPVLALNGENDLQVIASQNLTAIKEKLPYHRQTQIKLYPRLNHLFQESDTGLPAEYASIDQTISPEVLQDITQWIQEL